MHAPEVGRERAVRAGERARAGGDRPAAAQLGGHLLERTGERGRVPARRAVAARAGAPTGPPRADGERGRQRERRRDRERQDADRAGDRERELARRLRFDRDPGILQCAQQPPTGPVGKRPARPSAEATRPIAHRDTPRRATQRRREEHPADTDQQRQHENHRASGAGASGRRGPRRGSHPVGSTRPDRRREQLADGETCGLDDDLGDGLDAALAALAPRDVDDAVDRGGDLRANRGERQPGVGEQHERLEPGERVGRRRSRGWSTSSRRDRC